MTETLVGFPQKKIENGLYDGVSNNEYHNGPGISKSGLDLINKAPAFYHSRYLAGVKSEPTPSMIFGNRVHEAVLEPHIYRSKYLLKSHVPLKGKTKVEKQNYADWFLEFGHLEVITDTDDEHIRGMAKALQEHETARDLLDKENAYIEQTAYWTDPVTGVLCRTRPDVFRTKQGILVDYKSTTDAYVDEFPSSVANYRYHVQHAFYQWGIETVTGKKLDGMVFIAQEKKPPYAIGIFTLDDYAIQRGVAEMRADLNKYAQCLKTKIWPGYETRVQEITLPKWY